MRATTGRLLGAGQVCAGLVTAVAPHATVRAATGGRGREPDARIVRVLGLRQLAQGTTMLARPTRQVFGFAALVDATHAASLVPVIVLVGRYRAAAAVSTLLAVLFAAAELRVAGENQSPSSPDARS